LIVSEPELLGGLLRFLRDRLVDRLLSTNPIFLELSLRDCDALKPRFRLLEVDPGGVLIEQGQRPAGLMIVLAGRAEVVRRDQTGEIKIGELGIGDVCGEMSLITQKPSVATVRASTKLWAIQLAGTIFQKIIEARPEAMAFIHQVIEQRTKQAFEILVGRARYREGRIEGM
jgi:CRP-like cAMP-binding protein